MALPRLKLPSLFRKRWLQALLLILAIFGIFFGWQWWKNKQNGFETYTVAPKDLTKTITASGKIDAASQVTLRFQTTGRLSWVGVKEGDRVEEWQAIAAINQAELEKELKQELLDYMNERWDFETTTRDTYKDLALTDVIQRAKDKAQFDLDRSVLDVEIADIAQKYATLITPIAGIVTEATDEQPGVNVSLLNTQYVITDPDSLRFTATIEELDIGTVAEGMPAAISLDAFPDETIESQVGKIGFTATETVSGTTAFEVYFEIPKDDRYRLDMNGDVEVEVQTKSQVLAVPIEAVEATEEGNQVKVLRDDKPETVPIETGMETDDYYEIVSGLKSGDLVVLP